jgi:arginase
VAHLHRFLDAGKEINFMRNIKLIEVPSEIGAGTRGASLGVEAIKVAAMDFMSNFFIHFPSERIPNENKLLYEPIESPLCKKSKRSLFDV